MKCDLLIHNARVITLADGATPRRGKAAMGELSIIKRGSVAITDGLIAEVGDFGFERYEADEIIDAGGRVLMPGFVDCHTHACWGGDRLDEFQMKLEGHDYLSILKAGGGIMSTVRATRAASFEGLSDSLLKRLDRMLTFGTTTAEVKSGYGLDMETELKMLKVIEHTQELTPMQLVATALLAHAVDSELNADKFFDMTIKETLPAVFGKFPGITIDAYCEDGAWPVDRTKELFELALAFGCKLRIHSDQFNSLGGTRMALELGAVSVDHLEATTNEDINLIGVSGSIAVLLPISGFQVDDRYARGRDLIDAGAAVAIATNYNPGSAPSPSMPFALALACRKLGMTPAEAITAATINGACVLGLQEEVGTIAAGKRADLVLWDEFDERGLAYEFATVPAEFVVAGGNIVYGL